MATKTKLNSLDDLLMHELGDLYDAEKRLAKALPKMAQAARNEQLAEAFRDHLRETEGQIARLEEIFGILEEEPAGETCEAMKGLIKEGDEIIAAKGDSAVRDAALIGAAQRVEHYEIAGYGTARTIARQLGQEDVAELLQETLDEESAADEKLTTIAERSVNEEAARSE